MKALLLIGNLRTFQLCLNSVLALCNKYNPDVFICISNVKYAVHPSLNFNRRDNILSEQEIIEELKPIHKYIRKYNIVDVDFQNNHINKEFSHKFDKTKSWTGIDIFKQYCNFDTAIQLMETYMTEHNFKYDMVIKSRFDLDINIDTLPDSVSESEIYTTNFNYVCDLMFCSTVDNIKKIPQGVYECFFNNPPSYSSSIHKMLEYIFIKNNIKAIPSIRATINRNYDKTNDHNIVIISSSDIRNSDYLFYKTDIIPSNFMDKLIIMKSITKQYNNKVLQWVDNQSLMGDFHNIFYKTGVLRTNLDNTLIGGDSIAIELAIANISSTCIHQTTEYFTENNINVAICMSGHLRNYNLCRKNIEEKIINPFKNKGFANVDLYISTWDVDGHRKNNLTHNKIDILSMYDLSNSTFEIEESKSDEFLSKYKTDKWKETGGLSVETTLAHSVSMWYKVYKSFRLLDDSDINYDIIVRIRPDIMYEHEINMALIKDSLLNDNTIYMPLWHGRYKTVTMEMMDQYAFGSKDAMSVYMNLYENIDELLREYDDFPHCAEGLLWKHLEVNNIDLRRFMVGYYIVRDENTRLTMLS